MTASSTRGACPSLRAPMETGDGLLVRLLPAGPIPLRAFAGLCAAASAHGNGTMEISARGSVQVRGLTPVSVPLFAAAVSSLKIDLDDGVPVIADPLPDDPAVIADTNRLSADLRGRIAAESWQISPKVSVVVDGGGRLHLDAVSADIRLRAVAAGENPKFYIALAGDAATAVPLGAVAPPEACDTILYLLAFIAAQGPEARAAKVLRSRGIAAFRDAIGTRLAPDLPPPPRLPADMVGTHCLKDDLYALGVGLAFGHAQGPTLSALTEIARVHGALWARPAPDRTLLLGPFKRTEIKTIRDEARRLDFTVDPADPRRRIVACPGAPSCASGLIAARTIAAEIAQCIDLPGRGIAVHVSGCAKGCAHPLPAPLTVIGTAQGAGLARNATARAKPSCYVDEADVAAAVEEFAEREPAHA